MALLRHSAALRAPQLVSALPIAALSAGALPAPLAFMATVAASGPSASGAPPPAALLDQVAALTPQQLRRLTAEQKVTIARRAGEHERADPQRAHGLLARVADAIRGEELLSLGAGDLARLLLAYTARPATAGGPGFLFSLCDQLAAADLGALSTPLLGRLAAAATASLPSPHAPLAAAASRELARREALESASVVESAADNGRQGAQVPPRRGEGRPSAGGPQAAPVSAAPATASSRSEARALHDAAPVTLARADSSSSLSAAEVVAPPDPATVDRLRELLDATLAAQTADETTPLPSSSSDGTDEDTPYYSGSARWRRAPSAGDGRRRAVAQLARYVGLLPHLPLPLRPPRGSSRPAAGSGALSSGSIGGMSFVTIGSADGEMDGADTASSDGTDDSAAEALPPAVIAASLGAALHAFTPAQVTELAAAFAASPLSGWSRTLLLTALAGTVADRSPSPGDGGCGDALSVPQLLALLWPIEQAGPVSLACVPERFWATLRAALAAAPPTELAATLSPGSRVYLAHVLLRPALVKARGHGRQSAEFVAGVDVAANDAAGLQLIARLTPEEVAAMGGVGPLDDGGTMAGASPAWPPEPDALGRLAFILHEVGHRVGDGSVTQQRARSAALADAAARCGDGGGGMQLFALWDLALSLCSLGAALSGRRAGGSAADSGDSDGLAARLDVALTALSAAIAERTPAEAATMSTQRLSTLLASYTQFRVGVGADAAKSRSAEDGGSSSSGHAATSLLRKLPPHVFGSLAVELASRQSLAPLDSHSAGDASGGGDDAAPAMPAAADAGDVLAPQRWIRRAYAFSRLVALRAPPLAFAGTDDAGVAAFDAGGGLVAVCNALLAVARAVRTPQFLDVLAGHAAWQHELQLLSEAARLTATAAADEPDAAARGLLVEAAQHLRATLVSALGALHPQLKQTKRDSLNALDGVAVMLRRAASGGAPAAGASDDDGSPASAARAFQSVLRGNVVVVGLAVRTALNVTLLLRLDARAAAAAPARRQPPAPLPPQGGCGDDGLAACCVELLRLLGSRVVAVRRQLPTYASLVLPAEDATLQSWAATEARLADVLAAWDEVAPPASELAQQVKRATERLRGVDAQPAQSPQQRQRRAPAWA